MRERPDFQAARLGVTAAQSQILLAKANAKVDVNGTSTSPTLQGRFGFDLCQLRSACFQPQPGRDCAHPLRPDPGPGNAAIGERYGAVRCGHAYEAVRSNDEIVQLYTSGYLKQAQDSRDISEYAYKRGAASLLDFLDAERSYRAAQLAYRQALASYMTALEQMKQAVGTRNLP